MRQLEGTKDPSRVTPQGKEKQKLIDGVMVRMAVTHIDERGMLTEVFNPAWGFTDDPVVYVYQTGVQPGKVKGWVQHHLQYDRLFIMVGFVQIVLYDDRPDSPTYGQINQLYFSEQNRGMVTIPAYVWHAVQNIGTDMAYFLNLPSRPYDHENPDKYRLPLNTDQIPFSFRDKELGW